jgi:hypothetical protein
LKAFSIVALKTKVVQNKILYNFDLRCSPRIQMDFELQIKVSSRFNKFILRKFCDKFKSLKSSAPKMPLNIS